MKIAVVGSGCSHLAATRVLTTVSIVFNSPTSLQIARFLQLFNVLVNPTTMSFIVTRDDGGFEWAGVPSFANYNECTKAVGRVGEEAIQIRGEFEHPMFNADAGRCQNLMLTIPNTREISYAGALMRYRIHKDGFTYGLKAAVDLGSILPADRRVKSVWMAGGFGVLERPKMWTAVVVYWILTKLHEGERECRSGSWRASKIISATLPHFGFGTSYQDRKDIAMGMSTRKAISEVWAIINAERVTIVNVWNSLSMQEITVELASQDDCFLTGVPHLVLKLNQDGRAVDKVNLLSHESSHGIWDADKLLILPEVTGEFILSVSMQLNENDRQLVGSIELSATELYEIAGTVFGIIPV
ncbi:hypothetical protein CPB86DRAFT_802339 [Serendipita vermifera]|nr:hypothetical protein CPB86DRAFT_802339 [Serendipita vermifera]